MLCCSACKLSKQNRNNLGTAHLGCLNSGILARRMRKLDNSYIRKETSPYIQSNDLSGKNSKYTNESEVFTLLI